MTKGRGTTADTATALAGSAASSVTPRPIARPWPGAVPGPAEAERAIAAALAAPVADASAIATRVAGEVSEIERSAFNGISVADEDLLKRVAGLRLRLATALATAPEAGECDEEAVRELLASADDVLAALARESAMGTKEVAAAIGEIRNDLIRDAIRVSEAHQRLAQPEVAPAPPARTPAPRTPAAAQVRLLSNEAEDRLARRGGSRRNAALWVVLALAVLAAGGYHANRAYEVKRAAARAVRVDGAPARITASPETADGQVLVTKDGKALTAAELERLRAAQRARGRIVVERRPGVYVIRKDSAAAAK